MPNEEILTGLKNAIEHGDSLEAATQIMVNSGYNPTEVQEAANFTSAGSINLQAEPEEELVMPEQKKSMGSKLKFWGGDKKKDEIPKPSESMKLSSEITKKQKIIPAQTQTLQPSTQQPVVQQTQPQQAQPVIQQTKQVQQAVIQQKQQVPVQQVPVQQKPSLLQQITRQVPPQKQQVQRQPLQVVPRQSPQVVPRRSPQVVPRSNPLTKDLKKIKPKGTSHAKEIILVVILLALIGVLTLTIMYRQTILSWFS
tara:strand:- start:1655 stop:2416 length:762 start_codon:yes stop_codon:yes gene_type:complete